MLACLGLLCLWNPLNVYGSDFLHVASASWEADRWLFTQAIKHSYGENVYAENSQTGVGIVIRLVIRLYLVINGAMSFSVDLSLYLYICLLVFFH